MHKNPRNKLSRRSFLASSLRAALFGTYALNSNARTQTPWSNWSGGLSCSPQGRYDIAAENQLIDLREKHLALSVLLALGTRSAH